MMHLWIFYLLDRDLNRSLSFGRIMELELSLKWIQTLKILLPDRGTRKLEIDIWLHTILIKMEISISLGALEDV
jgi:hypothetical protein